MYALFLFLKRIFVTDGEQNLLRVHFTDILELLDNYICKLDQFAFCVRLQPLYFVADLVPSVTEAGHHRTYGFCVVFLEHFHVAFEFGVYAELSV